MRNIYIYIFKSINIHEKYVCPLVSNVENMHHQIGNISNVDVVQVPITETQVVLWRPHN
jgi:hypothetical protein